MEPYDILKESACTSSLAATTKQECLLELSRLIAAPGGGFELGELLEALERREEQGSTAFGDGVAIPHARMKKAKAFVLGIGVSRRGIDFQSADGRKTHLFFVLVGPESRPEEYLKLLAGISRVAKDRRARKDLRSSAGPTALREAFFQHILPDRTKYAPKGKRKLLVLVLYEQQYLNDILELYLERGIRGASVVESTGIRDVLSRVPLFADLLNFLGERKQSSKTITAIIDEAELPELVDGVEAILGDLDSHAGAMIYTLDVSFAKGSLEI